MHRLQPIVYFCTIASIFSSNFFSQLQCFRDDGKAKLIWLLSPLFLMSIRIHPQYFTLLGWVPLSKNVIQTFFMLSPRHLQFQEQAMLALQKSSHLAGNQKKKYQPLHCIQTAQHSVRISMHFRQVQQLTAAENDKYWQTVQSSPFLWKVITTLEVS